MAAVRGDGDGWVECQLGHRHWGKFGAAGLLVYTAIDGRAHALLQHRAPWCHHGDTWGIPGGARDSHESPSEAALREAAEEAGIAADSVTLHREVVDDHGEWTYTTVVAHSREAFLTAGNDETLELRWQPLSESDSLSLHPGFGGTWPQIRATSRHLLVDTANVLGTTPNGWWRDRVGATTALARRWADLPTRVVSLPARSAPAEVQPDVVITAVTAVLEGQGRSATTPHNVQAIHAIGSGDDALVEHVLTHPDQQWLVVTADRGLRQRLPESVDLASPKWLLALEAGG